MKTGIEASRAGCGGSFLSFCARVRVFSRRLSSKSRSRTSLTEDLRRGFSLDHVEQIRESIIALEEEGHQSLAGDLWTPCALLRGRSVNEALGWK